MLIEIYASSIYLTWICPGSPAQLRFKNDNEVEHYLGIHYNQNYIIYINNIIKHIIQNSG